jgi:hypothetical protein
VSNQWSIELCSSLLYGRSDLGSIGCQHGRRGNNCVVDKGKPVYTKDHERAYTYMGSILISHGNPSGSIMAVPIARSGAPTISGRWPSGSKGKWPSPGCTTLFWKDSRRHAGSPGVAPKAPNYCPCGANSAPLRNRSSRSGPEALRCGVGMSKRWIGRGIGLDDE